MYRMLIKLFFSRTPPACIFPSSAAVFLYNFYLEKLPFLSSHNPLFSWVCNGMPGLLSVSFAHCLFSFLHLLMIKWIQISLKASLSSFILLYMTPCNSSVTVNAISLPIPLILTSVLSLECLTLYLTYLLDHVTDIPSSIYYLLMRSYSNSHWDMNVTTVYSAIQSESLESSYLFFSSLTPEQGLAPYVYASPQRFVSTVQS